MELILSLLLIGLLWMIYDIIHAPVLEEQESKKEVPLHEETKSFLKEYKNIHF